MPCSQLLLEENGATKPMWVYPEVGGVNPAKRWGHTAWLANEILYIFGGCCGGHHYSDLLALDLRAMAWKSLVTTGQQPGLRDSHSAVLASNKIIIFGGTNGRKKINDVHILDISTQSWYHPIVQGIPPPPRESHTATLFGNDRIVIFGGSGEGDGIYLNDVHVLDLKNMEWSQPSVKGELPSCRDSHTSVVIEERLIVYGGDCGDRYLGGVDILDLRTFSWSKLEISGSGQPGGRAGHTAVNVGNKMYVFGGVGDRAYFNDVWMLDITTRTWSAIHVAGPEPQGRFSHVSVVADNKIAIYGGCGEDERPLNEFLFLCLEVDEVSEDSPLRKCCNNRSGIGCRREGRKTFRNTMEADQANIINYLEERGDPLNKRDRRLIDLVGAHGRRMCAQKEAVYESSYKRKAEPIARRPFNQAGYSPIPDGMGICHPARRSTIASSADLNTQSKNVLQRRVRSRSVPLPFNAQAQDGPENHSEWKRRKTTPLQYKVEGEDFQEENDEYIPLLGQFLPDGKQASRIINYKNQQMQYCTQKSRQHLEQPRLALHAFCTEQESPKGKDVEKLQTVQLQLHLPVKESKPLCRKKEFQLLQFGQEQEVGNQDLSTKGFHRRKFESSFSGETERVESCSVMTTKKVPDLVGAEVQGMVDGVFETGYLMTAQMNGQVLRGVLFPHCSAHDVTAEVKAPSSDHQSHVALRASIALQTSCIAPSIVQSSSHKTVTGYPAFSTFPSASDVQSAASSSPLCTPNEGPYAKNIEARLAVSSCISCRSSTPCSVPATAKSLMVASSVQFYQQESLTGTKEESTDKSLCPDQVRAQKGHRGSMSPYLSMLGTQPAAMTGGRWVWQSSNPQSVPCNSGLCDNTSDNFIPFVPLPHDSKILCTPPHVDEAQLFETAPASRAALKARPSTTELDVDIDSRVGVTLSLAAPGQP